jgi:hypothetical protein
MGSQSHCGKPLPWYAIVMEIIEGMRWEEVIYDK